MSSEEEEVIIRNGTPAKWFEYSLWKYFIVFGQTRVRALWVVLGLLGLAGILGRLSG